MLRSGFDRDLQRLETDLMSLGRRTEQVIVDAVTALRERDFDDSRRIIAEDAAIAKMPDALEAGLVQEFHAKASLGAGNAAAHGRGSACHRYRAVHRE